MCSYRTELILAPLFKNFTNKFPRYYAHNTGWRNYYAHNIGWRKYHLSDAAGKCTGQLVYANFLQDELPALLENAPLQTLRQLCYQHDGAPPHFSQFVRQYLNHKFPNR